MKCNLSKSTLLGIGSLVVLGLCKENKAKADNRPNIIVIMTDDQSPIVPPSGTNQSHPFGFNGDPDVHTPVIDNLANNGMVFTNAYVSSSVSSPSRYTTLTGRYAGRSQGNSFLRQFPLGTMTRVENNVELEENRDNLPRLLQRAGYQTGFVGKSHVVDHHLLDNTSNWVMTGLRLYGQQADPHDPAVSTAMGHNHDFWVNRLKEYGFDYANAVYAANLRELYNDSLNVHNLEWKNKAALDFIDKAADDGPFFLYYSETVPHGPAPWIKRNGKYVHGLDANPHFTSRGYTGETFDNMPGREWIKQKVAEAGKDQDQAWLTWFDQAVGSVIDKLEEKGILENTLIIITSDHGDYNFGKSTLYQGGVKIPLLAYWPAGINPGASFDGLVQNIDFTPTFLDLAGVDLSPIELDGVSLKETLKGSQKPVHDYLFFEIGFARGVMTRDWKYITVRYTDELNRQIEDGVVFTGWNGHTHMLPYYIRNSHLGYHSALLNENYFDLNQLYDLKNDPFEDHNVHDSNPDRVAEMRKLLIEKLGSFPGRPYGEFQ